MKKKVCLVKWIVNGVDGGLKVATSLANELSKNYDVHFISVISTEKILFDINENVIYKNLYNKKLSMSRNFFYARKLLRDYFKKNDIDIAIGVGISMNLLIGTAVVGLKTKVISHEHMNSISANFLRSQKIQRKIGVRLADKVITLTEEDKEHYSEKYSLVTSKVDYIYNWMDEINLDNVEYDINSKKLITVGRFDPQKGYDYLAKVAVKVLSKYPGWQWDIYGSGDEKIKEDLIDELEKGGVVSQVNFMGNVKGTENIYPNHGIYVMTSRYEGLPLVLLEAKQYGLPIVSFSCPTGPSEIVIDGENGYLIDNYDVDQMSEKIIKLIEDRDLRESFSRNAMKDTEKFNKEKILKQWVDLIEEMTGGENVS